MTKESFIASNTRFAEYAKANEESRKSVQIMPPPALREPMRENTRITSRDIFCSPGSATSEVAIARLRAKEDENNAAILVVVSKTMSK